MFKNLFKKIKKFFGLDVDDVIVEELPKAVEEVSTPKRTRNKKGQFKADDPSTSDVNEAWVGGKSPSKNKKIKKAKK